MGAIAAAVVFDGSAPADIVRSMLRAAPHRGVTRAVETAGPCAIGISADDAFVLATLASDGSWAAAVVGNLDNWDSLAVEVAGRTGGPAPDSAAAMVIAAFRVWGPDAVKRFRGAFTGVLWNGEVLWCFRDQVGFQPLFYRRDDRAFYCASEAKQVARGAGLDIEPDFDALEVLFYRGTGDDTAIKGVKRFLSSTLARIDRAGAASITRFWDPSPLVESVRMPLPDARARLVELLDQAVRRVMTGSDAVMLSGGIDSPTVAAFAAPAHLRLGNTPLVAINTSYPEFPSVEEGAYVRRLAEYLSIPVHAHVLTGSPISDLDTWTELVDGPWDSLPIPQVIQIHRLARELGVRTILTGELAEYVFTVRPGLLGYLLWRGRWRALRRHARGLATRGRPWHSVWRAVAQEAMPAMIGKVYARLRSRRTFYYPAWVNVSEIGASPYQQAYAESPRSRWKRAQVGATRGTTSTLEADEIAAASCGVRVRRPLADVDLWEFLLSLPAEVKFPDPTPKSLLRRAMRGRLPDEILDRRRKTIFDEYALGTADFEALQRWIEPSEYRMRGVDYDMLRTMIANKRLMVNDLLWAYNLARVHAFVKGSRPSERISVEWGMDPDARGLVGLP